MLSNHYPLAFSTEYSWLIASLVFLTGVTIRHYFNTMHSTGKGPHWTWAVTVLLFVLIAWLSTVPGHESLEEAEARTFTAYEQKFAEADGFEAAHEIVMGRCSMCHAREPFWDGIRWAPKGVFLETPTDIAKNANAIYLQAGVSHAMPPANITGIEPEERQKIAAWFRAGNS